MAKVTALVLVAAAAIILAIVTPTPGFLAAPVRQRAVQATPQANLASEATGFAPATATVAAAALVGLFVGLAAGPQLASAGIARSLPDFSLARPEYMQGVDASNAAKNPGEVDYVTRSQIQWLQTDKTREELALVDSKIKESPTKAERVQRVREQLRELAPEADIPA